MPKKPNVGRPFASFGSSDDALDGDCGSPALRAAFRPYVYGQQIKNAVDILCSVDVLDDMFKFGPCFKKVVDTVAAGRSSNELE